MKFLPTSLDGVILIEQPPHYDERGYFVRTYCKNTFAKYGINDLFVQTNISGNNNKGTLRGLHFQCAPYQESKLVRCIKGSVWDVVVDIDPRRESFGSWFGVELSAENMRSIYVPTGYAHGFLTLHDDSELLYIMGNEYSATAATGLRWNDPTVGIEWPITPTVISTRDRTLPNLSSISSNLMVD